MERNVRALYTAMKVTEEEAIEKQKRNQIKHSDTHIFTDSLSKCTVRFLTPLSIVSGDCGSVRICIIRIGNKDAPCEFSWRTKEKSATPGEQFLHAHGTFQMPSGEDHAYVSVKILDDPKWNTALEFEVVLENGKGCELDYTTHLIKILDPDAFPTNQFRDNAIKGYEEGGIQDINEFSLFRAFIVLMSQQEGIIWRTIITVFVGVLHNLYEYMSLLLSMYMVDQVFNFDSGDHLIISGDRLNTLVVVALLNFSPRVVFFFLDHVQIQLDISGKLRQALATNLFRQYLNYNEESRAAVKHMDMVTSVTNDVADVSFGYLRALKMLRLAGQISIGIFFTLQQNPGVWWAVIACPTFLFCWGVSRYRKYVRAAASQDQKTSNLMSYVDSTLSKLTLIINYGQRGRMYDNFVLLVSQLKKTRIVTRQVSENNLLFPKLMGPLLIAVYIVIGGDLVISRNLALGRFLATLRVFGSMFSDFADFYEMAMDIIGTFPALEGLTVFFNKRTELEDVMKWNLLREQQTFLKFETMPREDTLPCVDQMDISLENLTFSYQCLSAKTLVLFNNLNFTAPQGVIVGIRTTHGIGRKTLLDLLNGRLHASDGILFVPSHLKTVMVTKEILILDMSLFANLTFGSSNVDPERVKRILEHFRMYKVLKDRRFIEDLERQKRMFNAKEPTASDIEEAEIAALIPDAMEEFRESERAMVNLVRGFIMNPEVMLVHRPFTNFYKQSELDSVHTAFKQHRDNRGFLMASEDKLQRRPRTVFLTPDSCEAHSDIIDLIWEIPDIIGGECRMQDSLGASEWRSKHFERKKSLGEETDFIGLISHRSSVASHRSSLLSGSCNEKITAQSSDLAEWCERQERLAKNEPESAVAERAALLGDHREQERPAKNEQESAVAERAALLGDHRKQEIKIYAEDMQQFNPEIYNHTKNGNETEVTSQGATLGLTSIADKSIRAFAIDTMQEIKATEPNLRTWPQWM